MKAVIKRRTRKQTDAYNVVITGLCALNLVFTLLGIVWVSYLIFQIGIC